MRYTATHRAPGHAVTPLGKMPSSRTMVGGLMLTGMLASGAATASAASASDVGSPTVSSSSSSSASNEAAWPSCDGDGIRDNCPPLDGESAPAEAEAPAPNAVPAATAMAVGGASESSTSSVVDIARQATGTDYVWGGESLSGMDCSGLVDWVYNQAGIDLNGNRTADQQMRGGQSISVSEAQPGDLVGYKTGGDKYTHIAIYVGDGKVIDASNNNDVVVERAMWGDPDWHAVTYR